MKIKKEYHNRVINITDPFIPGGTNYRLGDLKASQVRAFYKQGLINDDILEPKKETPKRTKKYKGVDDMPKQDNGEGAE